MKIILVLLFFFSHFSAGATEPTVEEFLLKRIFSAQSKSEQPFAKGMFPSYREYYFNRGTLKKDDNVFFTALVAYTLRSIRNELDNRCRSISDSIVNLTIPGYKKFQNRRGLPVYSFWMTTPQKYFPDSWLSIFKTQSLPDDLDCTAMVLLAMNAQQQDVRSMHNYIQSFVNGNKKRVLSTFSDYRYLPAYSTWLSHKVPVDFDVCALSNVLLLVNKYGLRYTSADSASLKMISESVRQRQYKTHPDVLAPYYNRTPVILYHLSRLMSSRKISELEKYKSQLIADAKAEYQKTESFLDKIILSTSLMRWGVMPDMKLNEQTKSYCRFTDERFIFFVANMASMLPNPFMRFLMRTNIARFDYHCPAYNDALVLEHVVMRKKFENYDADVF